MSIALLLVTVACNVLAKVVANSAIQSLKYVWYIVLANKAAFILTSDVTSYQLSVDGCSAVLKFLGSRDGQCRIVA